MKYQSVAPKIKFKPSTGHIPDRSVIEFSSFAPINYVVNIQMVFEAMVYRLFIAIATSAKEEGKALTDVRIRQFEILSCMYNALVHQVHGASTSLALCVLLS